MTELLTEMDAFELRWQLVHGLHPSDGLVVHVVDESTLLVVGTDSTPHPKHGIYLATGRRLELWRDLQIGPDRSWLITQIDAAGGPLRVRRIFAFSELADDLAWVRQRPGT